VQSVTKNPIAEPGILGINAGGGFAIALYISVGKINADNVVYVLPLIRILGGITAALIILIFSFSKNEGGTPGSMVLIGVGLQSALDGGSITSMSKFDDKRSDLIAAAGAGNSWGDEWPFVIACLPWVLIIFP
ncbi:iron chelate uptake ABC transporter family permease subunit, partial [Staphylococcus aureus]|uniref:iron chelate uptake ABC transporter family permease subunit n=1 Tax=Staphylococcus aureus TaxID=1280 RepID=UPI00114D1088